MTEEMKIKDFVSINQLQEPEFPVISEVKWCQTKFPKKYIKTRDKWYNDYTV